MSTSIHSGSAGGVSETGSATHTSEQSSSDTALRDGFFSSPRTTLAAAGFVAIGGLLWGSRAALDPRGEAHSAPAPNVPSLVVPTEPPSEKIAPSSLSSVSPSPGWKWAIPPKPLAEVLPQARGDATFLRLMFVEAAAVQAPWRVDEGEILVPLHRDPEASYQLVLFNKDGERLEINPRTRDARSFGFFLTAIPDVHAVGVQEGRPEVLAQIARESYERASSAGMHVLPPSTIGEAYDFTLATTEGRTVSSADLRGKVVVVFEWATWCMSCHALMNQAFPMLEKFGDKVQIVTASHDVADRESLARQQMGHFPAGTINTSFFSIEAAVPEDSARPSEQTSELWSLSRRGLKSYGIPVVMIIGADGKALFDASSPSVLTLERVVERAVTEADRYNQKETP